MQGYAAGHDTAFAQSRECYQELEDWLASEDAAGLQHCELEEQLGTRGRELLRQLFQDRLDVSAAREVRCRDVAGEDGVVRTRAERGRTRPLMTKFGQVTVTRIAYRSPGRPNVHPADAALNLPEEKHSHGLRRLTAVEAARGSMEDAQAAVTRATGVRIGKRQLECSATRWLGTSASRWVGMTGDGKGPAGGAGGALWCSGCRGGGRVVVVSRSRG
jgi:hypothetical protein